MLKNTLKAILNGSENAPRWKKIKECNNYHWVLKNMLKSSTHYESRPFNYKYLLSELVWYLSGDKTCTYIKEFAKLRGQIADSNSEVNSNYGYLTLHKKNEYWYTQYQRVLDSLKKDKDTRQAIMYYWGPFIQKEGNKDIICTFNNQFFIRDNKLDCIVTMRSNDAWFGLSYDILWFSLLTQSIRLDLLETYPDLKLGKIYHNVGSIHLYFDFWDKAKQILKEKWRNLKTILNKSLLSISQEQIETIKKLTLKGLKEKKWQIYYKNILLNMLPIVINY